MIINPHGPRLCVVLTGLQSGELKRAAQERGQSDADVC